MQTRRKAVRSIHAPSTMSPNRRDIADGGTYEPRMIRAITIVRTQSEVHEASEALCYGRDVTAHLSVIGMTIVKGR